MSQRKKIGFLISGLVMLAGIVTWFYQYQEGLVLTHMRNSYSWGLYVSGLAFFVGNAAGGLVLSSLIYLFGVKSLKPFAKLGALTAFANVTAAMISILPDIGKPLRLYNMLLHPHFDSPLVWDVIVLNLYAGLSLLYLYILMLPELKGPLAKIAIKVDHPGEFSEKWAKRLAPFSLVAAIGIHVVTAWIFSTQGGREWWFTAAMAPDFIAVAVSCGTAVVFIVSLLTYGFKEAHQPAYRSMATIMAAALFVHLFLMYNDFIIHFWYGAAEALSTLSITFIDYGAAHALEVFAPLLAVILLLNRKIRQRAGTMIASCLLLILGVLSHRFLIMPAAFDKISLTIKPLGLQHVEWSMPIASGQYDPLGNTFVTKWHYFPSIVEIIIFMGVVAFMCFVILFAIDRFPIAEKADA
ncbi:MAG: molybdopterin oxidoreductase [Deltaproteobacteria bacterium]|nr:MAG: molybdopterin oxidoreductase [Deltaproteobacteria bacterium]RUA03715.1 MAG: molybdopterin oxidoreductase [Deltaproteobacteria bacterium]